MLVTIRVVIVMEVTCHGEENSLQVVGVRVQIQLDHIIWSLGVAMSSFSGSFYKVIVCFVKY